MSNTTIQMIFPSPWGILENRREEIERGGYGTLKAVFDDEINRLFVDISTLKGNHPTLSAKRLRAALKTCEARYIVHEGRKMFLREDIELISEEQFKQEK